MSVLDLLWAELRSGFQRLPGARLSLVVPIDRAVVGEVLALAPGLPSGVAVVLGRDQRVQVRYGAFHVNATLRREVDLSPAPVLTLELASSMVAWGIGRMSLPPFVRVSGRDVQVWLAEIPSLRDLAAVWRHVEHITCTLTDLGIEIDAAMHVTSVTERTASDPEARPVDPRHWPGGTEDAAPGMARLVEWGRQQVANGLPALAGARLSVIVPLPVAMLNELAAAIVADVASDRMAPQAADTGVNLAMLARLVRHARLDAAPGVVTLDVEVGVDG